MTPMVAQFVEQPRTVYQVVTGDDTLIPWDTDRDLPVPGISEDVVVVSAETALDTLQCADSVTLAIDCVTALWTR